MDIFTRKIGWQFVPKKVLAQFYCISPASLVVRSLIFLIGYWSVIHQVSAARETTQLSIEERQYLDSIEVITYCIDPDWMPFEAIIDGKITGMTADILQLVERELNKPLKLIKTTSWNESLEKARQGECALLPMVSHTKERAQYLLFSEPYLHYSGAIIALENLPFISGLQELEAEEIAIVEGSSIWEYVGANYSNNSFVVVSNVEEGLLKVSAGQVSAFLVALPVAAYHIKRLGLTNLKVAGHTEIRKALRFGISDRNPELLSIVQLVVDSFKKEAVDSIYNKWQSVRYQYMIDYSLLWKVLLGLLIAAAIIIYRFREIAKYNLQLTRLTLELEQANSTLEKTNNELEIISRTDSLTGLYNRRYVEECAQAELNRMKRYLGYFSLIMIDIDWFKKVNDQFGHDKGDYVLKGVAELLIKRVRKTDIVGRWGGEEFIVLCPHSKREAALAVAEYLRGKLENHEFELPMTVTASFGVAEYQGQESLDELISRCDKKLYEAKRSGRNLVKGEK